MVIVTRYFSSKFVLFSALFLVFFSASSHALLIKDVVEFNRALKAYEYVSFHHNISDYGFDSKRDRIISIKQIFEFREIVPDENLDFDQWDVVDIYQQGKWGTQRYYYILRDSQDLIAECCDFIGGWAKTFLQPETNNVWLGEVRLEVEIQKWNAAVPEANSFMLLMCGFLVLFSSRKFVSRIKH